MFEGVIRRGCGACVVRMWRHSEGGASVCPANNSACVHNRKHVTFASCTTSFVTSLVL